MEHESYKTPIKVFTSPRIRALQQQQQPGSLQKKNRHKYHLIPIIHTSSGGSPSRCGTRFPKIVNPFEQHLADRLHLPVICSPSLFHRPATPQHSSTQFEWTIDDVSCLAPANVEVSHQQFEQCHDPELEERAQAAINSYFKENEIVPSPIDCQLRKQKIVLHESSAFMSGSSSGKKRKNTRNGAAQTVLTFPPTLSKEIEDLLAPFCTYTQDQQQSESDQDCDTTIDHDARDASLRRKLFDVPFGACANTTDDSSLHDSLHDIDLQALSPPPKTPEIDTKQIKLRTRNFGTPLGARNLQFHEKSPNISISPVKKDTFGSLSPISKVTPPVVVITKARNSSADKENLCSSSSDSSLYRSTPEKSRMTLSTSSADMSVDRSRSQYSMTKHFEMSIDQGTESNAAWEFTADESKSKTTPVRRRSRIASKNLSLSFSLYAGDNKFMDETEVDAVLCEVVGKEASTSFYRTDSGFTETSSTMNDSLKHFEVGKGAFGLVRDENSMDISMRSDL